MFQFFTNFFPICICKATFVVIFSRSLGGGRRGACGVALASLSVGPRWYQAVVDLFWLSDNVKNVFLVPVVFVGFCYSRRCLRPTPLSDRRSCRADDDAETPRTPTSRPSTVPTVIVVQSLRAHSPCEWETLGSESSAKTEQRLPSSPSCFPQTQHSLVSLIIMCFGSTAVHRRKQSKWSRPTRIYSRKSPFFLTAVPRVS